VPRANVTIFEDQTIRQVVHVSVGGDELRVRLSNEFGDRPLVLGEAHVARGTGSGSAERTAEGTDRMLTFGGRSTVIVPPGAPALSDPVALAVPALSDLVVSVYLPARTEAGTTHAFAFQQNVVAAGNVTGAAKIDPSSVIEQWYFLTGISVAAGRSGGSAAIVALGDSITDGATTTVGANRRWPDVLARRLRTTQGLDRLGVLNAGIAGNRLLHDPNPPPGTEAEEFAALFGPSGLRRFDRDVCARPGARYAIVLLGVNDLGHPGVVASTTEEISAADLIAGHRQLIARAHERGLKIFGGTITPFENDAFGMYNAERAAARQSVNTWIRTGGEHDGVIDFDAALCDPDRPERLLAGYDSGDHLHPNDAGAEALANAVSLRLFQQPEWRP
jgi:lysophospholipase L1-like esterase